MIYTDNCCCCVELKVGCIIISIVEVIIRGLDRFIVDRDFLLGLPGQIICSIYLISCIILLIGALLGFRWLLLPYLFVALIFVLVLVWESVYVIIVDTFYDFVIFDIIQAVLSLYFCLVVYSYYDALI